MIRYISIDDEHMAHTIIKDYASVLPNLKLMTHCYDALEALEYLSKNQVDLIFLDLNMPKLKGFDFLKTLTAPPKVIVTTAYQEHALEGYELGVVDYLLKPFSFERFVKAVNKAVTSAASPGAQKNNQETQNAVFLRQNKTYVQVWIADIQYLESAGNYTKVVTTKETITVRDKISELLHTLASDTLIQVHKSFAVAKPHISKIEGNRIHLGEQVIPIGKTYKRNVIGLLG